MKANKLIKFLSITVCCAVTFLWSEAQCMDEEIQNIQAGGKRYVMDSQSKQLNEDQDAKDKNDKLGVEARRAKNQVGRGYIDNPNQQKILKKNQEIQKLKDKIALATFKGGNITEDLLDLFMDENPDFGEQ